MLFDSATTARFLLRKVTKNNNKYKKLGFLSFFKNKTTKILYFEFYTVVSTATPFLLGNNTKTSAERRTLNIIFLFFFFSFGWKTKEGRVYSFLKTFLFKLLASDF